MYEKTETDECMGNYYGSVGTATSINYEKLSKKKQSVYMALTRLLLKKIRKFQPLVKVEKETIKGILSI